MPINNGDTIGSHGDKVGNFDTIHFTRLEDIKRVFFSKNQEITLPVIKEKIANGNIGNTKDNNIILEENPKISYDENIETYNVLMHGHDGIHLPPIARQIHDNGENTLDYYPSH